MLTIYLKRLQLLGLILLCVLPAFAQKQAQSTLQCDIKPLSPAKRRALEAEATLAFRIKQASMSKARLVGTITYVPIRPHILRKVDGTGGLDLREMNNIMALTNRKWLSSGIQFFFSGTTPDYIDNDALATAFRKDMDEPLVNTRNVTNAMNQYYVPFFSNSSAGGYASYPANDLESTESYIRNSAGGETFLGDVLVPHELGHNFNLIHTHEPTTPRELVNGSNCTTAGDLVCDTPADPYSWAEFPGSSGSCVTGCPSVYICNFTETGTGSRYNPLPNNIMSYYAGACQMTFTNGQFARVQAALALRQAHTAYSLTAVSTNVTPVSNLSATIVSARVVLTWIDGANNEMGYFIERSTTSATDGFVPIGGVATDATSFTDVQPPSSTTAYYRIRPSNGTGNISPVASLVLPVCQPIFAHECSEYSTGIGSFTVNSQALSQNTGCSVGSYGQFTAVTPTVNAGSSFSFTVAPINRVNPIHYSVWVDFNQNGSFTDAGELLFQTPASTTANVSGTLTIPASALAGIARLRLIARSSFSSAAGDPCGSYDYGEAEDYQLNVTPICAATLTVAAVPSLTITFGQAVTLTVSGAYSYTWGGGSTGSSFTALPASTTAYSVTGTNTSGCVGTTSVTVTVNPGTAPTVQDLAATTATICAGGVATFTATLGNVPGIYTFTLTNGSGPLSGTGTGTAFSQTLTTSGSGLQTFTLTIGASATTGSASTTLDVGAIPTAGLLASGVITCLQSSVSLTASGGVSYVFSGVGITASSGSSATVNQGGSFSVIVTGASSCTSTTATTVSSSTAAPAIGVSVSGPITCLSPSVTLVGSGGNTYTFDGPAVVPSGVNAGVVSVSGVYSVTALFANSGCFSTTTVTVTGSATGTLPTVSLVGSGSVVCAGADVLIAATVSGSASYGWYKDGQLVSQSAPPLMLGGVQKLQAGSYVLDVASDCGSATSSPFILTVKPLPQVVITFPGSASVQTVNGLPIVTVPNSGNLFYSLSGGVLYNRYVLIDRINGYLIRQYMETTDGVFPINQYGPYTITVRGANNCVRVVEGEVRAQ